MDLFDALDPALKVNSAVSELLKLERTRARPHSLGSNSFSTDGMKRELLWNFLEPSEDTSSR